MKLAPKFSDDDAICLKRGAGISDKHSEKKKERKCLYFVYLDRHYRKQYLPYVCLNPDTYVITFD